MHEEEEGKIRIVEKEAFKERRTNKVGIDEEGSERGKRKFRTQGMDEKEKKEI